MSHEHIFFFSDKKVPRGSFVLIDIPAGTKGGDMLDIRDAAVIFNDEGSMAEDFEGIGILRKAMKEGKSIGIVYNPLDGQFELPHEDD